MAEIHTEARPAGHRLVGLWPPAGSTTCCHRAPTTRLRCALAIEDARCSTTLQTDPKQQEQVCTPGTKPPCTRSTAQHLLLLASAQGVHQHNLHLKQPVGASPQHVPAQPYGSTSRTSAQPMAATYTSKSKAKLTGTGSGATAPGSTQRGACVQGVFQAVVSVCLSSGTTLRPPFMGMVGLRV